MSLARPQSRLRTMPRESGTRLYREERREKREERREEKREKREGLAAFEGGRLALVQRTITTIN